MDVIDFRFETVSSFCFLSPHKHPGEPSHAGNMSLKEPVLSHAYTLCGTNIEFITEDTVTYRCGNAIAFLNIRTKAQTCLIMEEGYVLDAFAVNFAQHLIVCGVHGKSSRLLFFQFGVSTPVQIIEAGAEIEYSHLIISRNGKRMVSVSRAPNAQLIFWDLATLVKLSPVAIAAAASNPASLATTVATKLVEAPLSSDDIFYASFNPRSKRQFLLGNQRGLTVWQVDMRFEQYSLTATEYAIEHDANLLGGDGGREILCHCWTTDDRIICGTPIGDLLMSDPTTRLLRVANAHASIECPIYCILLSRKYIIVAAESGFLYWVSLEDFEIAYAKDTETKGIFTATFAPDYLSFVSADLSSTLMHGTFAGDIAVLTEETRQNDKWVKLTPILQRPLAVNLFSHEPVAYGLDSFVSSNRVVSFGLDGSLMVWDYGTNELVGLHYFQAAVTAVACNPDDTLIGVGFESGAVGIVDATAPSQLRLIFLERMHEKPVKFVKFSSNGQMLVTVGEDSRVFFIRVRDLSAVGYRQVPFDVCAFNVFPCAGMDRVFVSSMHGQLQTMQLPPLGTTAPTGYMLDDDLIKPHISDIQIAATALHQDLGNDKWFIVLGMDKKLRRIEFSGTKAQLDIKSVYEGHAKVASVITVSPDGRFLATGGCDGAIIIRRTDNMFNQVKISPHSFASRGGVIGLQFTNDSRFLISSGADGAIFCWNLQQIVRRDSSKRDALKPIIQPQVLVEVPSVEEFEERADAQTGEGDIVLPPLFLDKMREEQARVLSNESQEKRNAFRTELQVLSDRFQQALQRNQMLPEIEKLEREAFIIDEAEVARVNAEGEKAANDVHDEVRFDNLGKELVTKRIRAETWDQTSVHGSALIAFRSGLEVTNFPVRSLTPKEQTRLEKIKFARSLELRMRSQEQFTCGPELTSQATYLININEDGIVVETNEEDAPLQSPTNKSAAAAAPAAVEDASKPYRAFTVSEMLYHPVQCFTNQRKIVQTALLRLKVEELQRAFNAKFDAAVELKKAEIYRLDEKAERVKEINEESRGEEPLFKPRMSKEERPETIFEVDESEITAERVLTKEEQAKKDAEEAEKAERARKAAEDDSRDRALLDMMNGTLVIKKDVSALDKQLVKEEWMTTIPYDKMSDEQKVQLADFEKREKTLATERENRRKLLDTDLKKVRGEIADICRFFDEKLQVLLDERMVVKQKCCTQELIIAKLMNSLLEEEERDREEVNLARRERELHTEKTTASMALNEFRRQVDACQKKADALAKEEKDLERNCRKEMFEMASDQLEMLMKLYKNRRVRRHITPDISASSPAPATAGGAPKVSMMMSLAMMSLAASGKASEQTQHILKTKGAMKAAGDADHESEDEDNMQDPFSEQTGKVAAAEVATRLAEMQFDPSEKPDDLEPEVWERLQKLRNLKIEKEMEAKAHGTILEDMRRHEAALIATEKALNDELVSTVNRKVAAREQRETLQLNTELLMQVRQGQVEIEEAPVVTDMSSAVMINRSIVEQLNGSIVSLGSETVQQLREIVYLRKGIRAQRWQQRRMQLQFEEYADRTIEFQLLRVTRELQDMIKSGGHEARQSNEIAKLEKKIEYTRQMTDTKIADRTYKLNKVLKKVRDMQEENRRLDQTIVELQNSVAERQNIWRIRQKDAPMPGTEGSGHEGSEAEAQRKRVAAVVERRRLVELAKQQAEEIEFLKSELERCRKRTFPSFQQMVPTHPDMK